MSSYHRNQIITPSQVSSLLPGQSMKFHNLDLSAFSNQIKIKDKKGKVDESGVSLLKLLQKVISCSISITAITAFWILLFPVARSNIKGISKFSF